MRALTAPSPSPSTGGTRLGLSCVPALVLAVLPKCPMCLTAYAGILSMLGLGSWWSAWVLPLTCLSLLGTLGALALRARRRRHAGPLWLGLLGAAVLLVGKFALDSRPSWYLGALLLGAAWFWSPRPRGRTASDGPSIRVPGRGKAQG